jgi:hypothetical protein
MADKTVTIKDATDQELNDLISRLSKESQLQSLIADIKRRSMSSSDMMNGGGYYDSAVNVSTEQPINKLYHTAEDVLAHFGISGMKWHSHKSATKTSPSADYTEARMLQAKGSKNLSTKELGDLTKRLQLEKQLRDLKTADVTRGADVAKTILGIGTTLTSIYALSTTPMGQAVKKLITKA